MGSLRHLELIWDALENKDREEMRDEEDFGIDGNFIIMDEERDNGCAANDSRGKSQAEKNEKIDGIRKHSFTEKLTGVKNSKADQLLRQRNSNLSREQARQLRLIHDNKSTLRHEYKLMQFDKKKNTLEVKKRHHPHYDFSIEEAGVNKSQQYLKEPVEGWYLQKHNAIRRRSVGDATLVTPIVAKARETLRQSELMKQLEQYRSESVSYTHDPGVYEMPQSPGKRPRSKSVSLDSLSLSVVSSANSSGRHHDKVFRKESPNMLPWTPRNPTIDILITDLETNEGQKVVANGKPIVKVSGEKFYDDKDNKVTLQSILHTEKMENSKGAAEFPNDMKTVPQKGVIPVPQQSTGKPHVSFQLKENIQNGGLPNKPWRKSLGQVRPQSELQTRRKSLGGTPSRRPVTHDMIQRETTDLQERMNKFYKNLENTKAGRRSEDDDELDILSVTPQPQINRFPEQRAQTYQTEDVKPNSPNVVHESSYVSAFSGSAYDESKPVPKDEPIFALILEDDADKAQEEAATQGQMRKLSIKSKWKFVTNKLAENAPNGPTLPTRKDSPDSNSGNQNRRGSVISLTGSEGTPAGAGGRRRSSVGIPSHSMERSNRHSATFKLRKLVTELMKQKTRYELSELEEVKRKQSEALEDEYLRSRTESLSSETQHD